MHARNFTTNVPKILDLKSSSEQIFFRKLSLGAPEVFSSNSYEVRGGENRKWRWIFAFDRCVGRA